MSSLTALLPIYGYWVLIPLSLLEGPVVAFVAGTLAASGLLNLYILGVLFFVSDLGKDAFYYALGHFGTRSRMASRLLARIGVTNEHFTEVRRVWEKHPLRTMFFGKVAYGVATGFIVLAGAIRMRLSTFFIYGAIVTVLQYGLLLVLGFFFGNALGGRVVTDLRNIQYAIGGITVFALIYYLISRRVRRVALEDERKELGV